LLSRRLYAVWFHFYEVHEQAKPTFDDRSQSSGYFWGGREELTLEGKERVNWKGCSLG
jgi:hypothetical protein